MSMHPTRNLFKEFRNEVFVETGLYRGDGIQLALDAGFETIFSIDNDVTAIDFCFDRFDLRNNPDPRIHLRYGDSAVMLCKVLDEIGDKRITFWLDSHWQMLEGTDPGDHPFPLMDELDQIRRHRQCHDDQRVDHTIIIDDMLIMQPEIVGYGRQTIEDELRFINPKYKLEYFANPVINSILVAYV